MVGVSAFELQTEVDKCIRQSSEAPAKDEIVVSSATDSIKSFIAGGFGGVSAVLVGVFKSPSPLHRYFTDRNDTV